MSKIVIVGAGLGGLYTANRLINEKVNPENIVLIDRRIGIYTRPGHINKSTFTKVQDKTGIDTSNHSPACHIKELERFMYEFLQSTGCLFLNETFIDMKPAKEGQEYGVITVSNDGTQHVYPANYVYDCSGYRGVVAQAVNNFQQKQKLDEVFIPSPLVDLNPIPDHLIAQIIVADSESIKNFFSLESTDAVPSDYKFHKSPEQNIAAREALRTLGWHYEAFPTFYTYSREAKGKVCAYMEAPPDLPEAKQQEWLNLLLGINSRGRVASYTPLKPAVKYEDKPRIMSFRNKIHVSNRATFKSPALPTVLIGFDALKGTDYRTASGVDCGIDCFEIMLMHTKVNNGSIESIDLKAIEKDVFKLIDGEYKSNLTLLLQNRQKSIISAYNYFSHLYETAAAKLSVSEKKNYISIATRLAVQAAAGRFAAIEIRVKDDPIASLEILNKALKSTLRVQTLLGKSETEIYYKNNERLQKVIQCIRLELEDKNLEFELDLLALDPDLANDSSHTQRLNDLFKRLEQNFNQLNASLAYKTVLKKISVIRSRINPYLQGANPGVNTQTSGQLFSDTGYSSAFFQAPSTITTEKFGSSATIIPG